MSKSRWFWTEGGICLKKTSGSKSANFDPSISNILQSVRSAVPAAWVWRAAATKALLTRVVPRGPRHRHVPGNAWYVRSELNPPWVTNEKNIEELWSKHGCSYKIPVSFFNEKANFMILICLVWRNFEPLSLCRAWLLAVLLCYVAAHMCNTKNHLHESCFRVLTEISDIRFIAIWECSNKPLSFGMRRDFGVFGRAWKYAKYLRSLRNCCRCSSCAFPNRALLDVMVLQSGMAENTLTYIMGHG